jgi:hypothetical protein
LTHNSPKRFTVHRFPGILSLWRSVVKYPERAALIIIAFFYFYHLRHWWWPQLSLFLTLALALNYVILRELRRRTVLRLQSAEFRPWPELALLAGALALAIALVPGPNRLQIAILAAVAWTALYILARLRKTGVFYASFAGLALWLIAGGSYVFLNLEERLYLYVRYYAARIDSAENSPDLVRWEESRGASGASVRRRFVEGVPDIELELPPELSFHDGRVTAFVYGLPLAGAPVAFLSASERDPFAAPALAIYESDSPYDAAALRREVEMILGQRRNAGETAELKYLGSDELSLEQAKLFHSAFSYEYRDLIFEEIVRLRVWIARPGAGRARVVLLHDPEVPGFPRHPSLERALRSLRLL